MAVVCDIVVASASVQDLAIVLDLEYEMLDHALGHSNLTIHKQTESDEVRIPVVELEGYQKLQEMEK
jgi:hypothetical protein